MDLFQYRSDQYEVFYHKRRRILYLYFPRVRLSATFDIQRHCTCSQQVVIHWWWLLLFHFSSPSTIVFRCVISPHRLSLISLMITSSVSFFFTWFLTKVLKCVEFKFLHPNFFCWLLLFHFSSHDFLTKRVSSNQKRLTKVGWHAI